jgi:transcriptional regulator GlxA family with amidase domain
VNRRLIALSVLGGVALAAAIGAAWLISLPEGTPRGPGPSIAQSEMESLVAALKPSKRQRPVIAIIGVNEGTEVTDYLMPYGILSRADVADVLAVATRPGKVKLYPALQVEPQATTSDFDRRFPEGADYVIVPAMHRDDDPLALQWIRNQAARGAVIIGVCAGAKVVAETGLLDGKKGTTHWYYLKGMLERHPTIQYVSDRRMVVDHGVVTTTGISASIPVSLTLIEAIAGRSKAEEVAHQIGLAEWDARHRSDAFKFTRPFALYVIGNKLAFWKHERVGIDLEPGVDEVSLALVADMWSRTYRSKATTFSATSDPVRSRGGLQIVPDEVGATAPAVDQFIRIDDTPPARVLDETLHAIGIRYGAPTADLVSMQLEYPRS